MLGLPKSTELSKQLPKKAIYEKFNMNTAAKEKFDADISRINIVAEISPNTVNITKGKTVKAHYCTTVGKQDMLSTNLNTFVKSNGKHVGKTAKALIASVGHCKTDTPAGWQCRRIS